MKQTAVEWLLENIAYIPMGFEIDIIKQAKEMEKQQKLKHQLFIGKVSDIIGFEKTIELLKECNNIIGGNDAE